MTNFIIFSRDEVAYWSNTEGWCETRAEADVFTEHQRDTLDLPLGGEWIEA